MNRPRIFPWAVVGGICLAIAAGLALSRRSHRLSLPAASVYPSLPAAFNQALQTARANLRDPAENPEAVRRLARLYHANGLYPEARACYQLIAAAAPGLTARDHYYLADIAQNQSDLPQAQTELRAVLQAEPGYLPARLALADTLFKSGHETEAAKEYSAVLAIEADHPQASLGLARIELQRGDEEAAVARLDELMAGHPELTSGAALFAQVLERRGETDRAIALRQLSRQKPEPIPPDPWMTELLADLYDVQRLGFKFEDYFRTGQITEATPLLHRIEELDPKSSVPQLLRGWAAALVHQDPEAVRQYRLALTKGGDPEKICPYLVQSLLNLGNVAEAAALMAGYYARMPDSAPITLAYSDVVVRQGDDRLARVLLTKVLQKEPYLLPQNMSLAKILWTSGERDEAAKCLQRVAAVFANDVPSRALLGEYYLGKSDPVAAIKPLEEACRHVTARTAAQKSVTSMLAAACLQAGSQATGRGDLPAAVNYYDKAIQFVPADPRAYAAKANACVLLQQFRPAAEALTRMAGLQPDNPTIYLSLGDVLYQAGEAAQARQQWERALPLTADGDAGLRAALTQRLQGKITPETFK